MNPRSFRSPTNLAGALIFTTLFATACGPQVFEGATAKVINPSPQEAPPPPPKVEEPPPPKRVVVTEAAIVINEKVMFDLNKSTIKEESHSLLKEVADTLNENPRIKKVRVEGHASADGNDASNMKLSKSRAKAVMTYLVNEGKVDAARLVSEGYGETQPLAQGDTEEAYEKNRRVEFKILEQDKAAPAEGAAAESK